MLLTLSHGQASLERSLLCEHQKEKHLNAPIRDHTKSVGGVNNFKINKSVVGHRKASRQRYYFDLNTLDQEER